MRARRIQKRPRKQRNPVSTRRAKARRARRTRGEILLVVRNPPEEREFRVRRTIRARPPQTVTRLQDSKRGKSDPRRSDRLIRVFASLAHSVRLQIMGVLSAGPSAHQEIANFTGQAAGPLYHHLRLLERAGLIEVPRRNEYRLTRCGLRFALLSSVLEEVARR